MNAHKISFMLDLDRQDSQVYVNVRKGETVAKLSVLLMEGGTPYSIADGTTAKLAATLPDGSYKETACTISDNRMEVELDADHTNTAGHYHAHFVLAGGGAALPTPAFTVNVDDPAAY